MEISICTKADFDTIIEDIADFWNGSHLEALRREHNPVYLYEFGSTAFVAKEGGIVVGYLLGLFSQTAPLAYVRLAGVRSSHRKQGIGRALYERFEEYAGTIGYTEMKAITSPSNRASVAFHLALGMKPLESDTLEDGVPVQKNYGGPGVDRVVFTREI